MTGNDLSYPETRLGIAPNPSSSNIRVALGERFERIIIHNLTGKMVLDESFEPTLDKELNIEFLQPGVYFVSVETSKGFRQHARLVKYASGG